MFVDGGWTVNDQLLSVPAMPLATSSVIDSVQTPAEFLPLNRLSGWNGWNRPENGAAPIWIPTSPPRRRGSSR